MQWGHKQRRDVWSAQPIICLHIGIYIWNHFLYERELRTLLIWGERINMGEWALKEKLPRIFKKEKKEQHQQSKLILNKNLVFFKQSIN